MQMLAGGVLLAAAPPAGNSDWLTGSQSAGLGGWPGLISSACSRHRVQAPLVLFGAAACPRRTVGHLTLRRTRSLPSSLGTSFLSKALAASMRPVGAALIVRRGKRDLLRARGRAAR